MKEFDDLYAACVNVNADQRGTVESFEDERNDLLEKLKARLKNHSDLSNVSKCVACGSSDLFKFKLEHIKCRECKELFEHGC